MLAYNVREHQGDQVVWVRRTKKLATYSDQYRTLASVKQLAEEILSPLNTGQARPESSDTVRHFIEHVYLPNCKANLRPSTYFGYTHVFKTLSPFLAGARMGISVQWKLIGCWLTLLAQNREQIACSRILRRSCLARFAMPCEPESCGLTRCGKRSCRETESRSTKRRHTVSKKFSPC
jgi:hypothetical protein